VDLQLTDKKANITGASRGFVRAIARQLASGTAPGVMIIGPSKPADAAD